MAKLTKEAFVKALKEMTLVEINELVDGLKEEFGIDPSAVVSAPAAGDAGADDAASEVNVVITSDGGAKVPVIKVVKEITGMGLMDAKKAVESLPYTIKEAISKDEADELSKKLSAAGAVVEIK